VRRNTNGSDTIVSAELYMTKRTTPRILFLLPALLCAADTSGVRPRVDRTQYAVAMFNQSLAVAAELVPAEKVRKQFGSDVDSRYLVVEVGMFPKSRGPLEVHPGDFVLRVNRTRHSISAAVPVAGYLYFPLADKKDGDNEYELEYRAQRIWMILPLHAGTLR
jgi:hypothetical protein